MQPEGVKKLKYLRRRSVSPFGSNYPRRMLYGCAILLLAAVAVFGVHGLMHRQADPLPRSVVAGASFPLYYPAKLPAGFKVQPESASQRQNVVTYYAQNRAGKRIFFSIQPVPKDAKIDDFYKLILNDKVDILSDYGKAAVGTAGGKQIGSLIADKSWVLVTASPDLAKKDLIQAVQNLKPTS